MRTVLVAALLLMLAIPAANAQLGNAILDLQVKAPTEPVGPEGAKVDVAIARVCPNPAMYLPEQIVRLEIKGLPGSIIDGPESVTFPARPCLQPASDEQFASFLVKLPAEAQPAMAFSYSLQADPATWDPVFGAPESQEADFQLLSPAAPQDPESDDVVDDANVTEDDLAAAAQDLETASESGEVMDVPAPSWLLAVAGIGLAALRRR